MKIIDMTNLAAVYDYQMQLAAPYFFAADFETWKESFVNDVDGEGRRLFKSLQGKAAYEGEKLVGFVQYGMTAFGFDDCGEISSAVSYPVIRALFFDKDQPHAGEQLLKAAMEAFEAEEKVYAFFHYFGMTCFARHGKLFEHFDWIRELLHRSGFVVEHENVYYAAPQLDAADTQVELEIHDLTAGNQQMFDFSLGGKHIGGCEVHYLPTKGDVFLRWIYVNDEVQNCGVGSQAMAALKNWLRGQGMTRLDTDTALNNRRAQHYYEKNGFTREGITRSYYIEK